MGEAQDIEPTVDAAARVRQRPARPWAELILCIVGSLATVQLAGIGTFAMVFGAWLLFRPVEGRGLWALAGCLGPALALCLVSFVDYGTLVLPCAVCALVIAKILPGRVSVTSVCLVILALAAAMAGADALFAASFGMDLVGYANAMLDSAYEITVSSVSQSSSPVVVQASFDGVYETMRKVWPLGYVFQATVAVLFGLLGLGIAQRRGYRDAYDSFMRYDVPLWGIVLLIVGLVCLLLASSTGQGGWLESIGLMLILVLRVVYFLQGMAVIMCLMSRRKMGFFSRVLILTLSLLAELSIFAVCVFGVVDVFANFRGLARKDGAPTTA